MKFTGVKSYSEGCGKDEVVLVVSVCTPRSSDVEYVRIGVAVLVDIVGYYLVSTPV